jgi:hypothetical protein
MERWYFTNASGERNLICCTLKGDVITVINGGPFDDYTGGKFERVLPDGTTETFLVVTPQPQIQIGVDGFGYGNSVQVTKE